MPSSKPYKCPICKTINFYDPQKIQIDRLRGQSRVIPTVTAPQTAADGSRRVAIECSFCHRRFFVRAPGGLP